MMVNTILWLCVDVLAFGASSADEGLPSEEMILLQLNEAAATEMRGSDGQAQVSKTSFRGRDPRTDGDLRGSDGQPQVSSQQKTGRYKGIIFPHISKVGGNSVRKFAKEIAQALGVPFENPEEHDDLSKLSAPESVIFLQDNAFHNLNDELKRDFFVIGTYRNPCDTALSHWAYVSMMDLAGNWRHVPPDYTAWKAEWNDLRGVSLPFDDAQSRINFKRYVDSGYLLDEEQRMREKYDTTGNIEDAASCWMNLYHLHDDLSRCLTAYLQHQNIQDVDVSAITRVVQYGDNDSKANPSPHPSCSSMFDSDMINHVSSLNQNVMHAFDLTCCSE